MAIRMDVVTVTVGVTSDLSLENIAHSCDVEVGEGIPPQAGLAAAAGALKSALAALAEEGKKYGLELTTEVTYSEPETKED